MKTDVELLDAWRAGDRRAGNELFKRHYRTVRNYFINKVDSELEDLIQGTFEAFVSDPERFEGRSTFLAYLRGIARNLLLQHWGQGRRAGAILDFDEVSLADLGAGPSTMLALAENHKLLLDALRRIRLGDQEILELYFFENLTGPQLAAMFGVPEDTVRSRVRRAKKALGEECDRLERARGRRDVSEQDIEAWAANVRVGLGRDLVNGST
jgi:RNA polymerase sigma factor (sigma-70 family)